VKRVSGQSIRRFAQSRIFGPLGMTHTHIHDDHTMVVPNRAIGYIRSDSGGPFRIEMSDWEQAGDGSVLTTVEDLVKPVVAQVASGSDTVTGAGSPVLPPERLQDAVGTYRNAKMGEVGRIVMLDGKLTLKFGGGSFALQPVSATEFRLADLDVRLRFNPAKGSRPRSIQLIGAGLDQPVLEAVTPFHPAPAALREFVGEYFSPELASTYRVDLEKQTLVLHARNLPITPLDPTIPDEFEYPSMGLTLHFTRTSGKVNGFTLASGRTQGIRFKRRQATSSLSRPPGQ
jgi:hypothetical protein